MESKAKLEEGKEHESTKQSLEQGKCQGKLTRLRSKLKMEKKAKHTQQILGSSLLDTSACLWESLQKYF